MSKRANVNNNQQETIPQEHSGSNTKTPAREIVVTGTKSTSFPNTPTTPTTSSWKHGRRRSSFLSEAMMHEVHSSYATGRAEDGSPRFSLSVRESQGFLWNQELFVSSHYRQSSSVEDNVVPAVKEIYVSDNEDIFSAWDE